MATETLALIYTAENRMTRVNKDVKTEMGEVEAASFALSASLRQMGAAGEQLRPQAKELASTILVQGNEFKEAGNKLGDALRKMGEFGATQAQLQKGLAQTVELSNKFGVSVGQSGEVLEELTLQLQDPTKALQAHETAMKVMIKTGRRADDSAEDVAKAFQGQTTVLKELSPRGERYAKTLDKIKDRNLRAQETVRLMNKEVDAQPNLLDKARDKWTLTTLKVSELTGGFDLLGPAAKAGIGIVVGVAAAASAAVIKLTSAAIDYAVEARAAFVEVNQEAQRESQLLDKSLRNLSIQVGETVTGTLQLNTATQEMAVAADFTSKQVQNFGLTLNSAKLGMAALNLGIDAFLVISPQFAQSVGIVRREFEKFRKERLKAIEQSRQTQQVLEDETGSHEFLTKVRRLQTKIVEEGIDALSLENKEFVTRRENLRLFIGAIEKSNEKAAKTGRELSAFVAEQERLREQNAKKGAKAAKAREKAEKDLFPSIFRNAAVQKDMNQTLEDMFLKLPGVKTRLKEQAEAHKELVLETRKFEEAFVSAVAEMDRQTQENFDSIERNAAVMVERVQGTFKEPLDPVEVRAAERLVETGDATSFDNAMLKVQLAKQGASELEMAIADLGVETEQTVGLISGTMQDATSAIGSGFASMMEQMVAGTFDLKSFGAQLLSGIGDIMISAGSNLLLAGTLGLQPALAAGGLALIAAGGALKGVGSRVSAPSAGAGSAVGASEGARRGDARRAEVQQERLERRFPDERQRRQFLKDEQERNLQADARREQFRRETFLEAVDRVLVEDRQRDRQRREISQFFEGARLTQGRQPTQLEEDTRTRLSIARLQRSNQLPMGSGNAVGLVPV